MAKVNRHLRGETNEIEIDVHGHTVIESGDIVWQYNSSSFAQKSTANGGTRTTADNYAYPISELAGVTAAYYDAQFLGVAMKGSISGTTEKIPVATSGIFRFPLKATTGVTIGELVCGATSASTTNSDQIVVSKKTSELTDEYYCILGICVKTEDGATNVDFNLITRFSGVSYSAITTGT